MSSTEQQSYDIGKSYAHKYENADANKVDKEVHDQLMQDFHKSMHSEVNMKMIKQGLLDESKQIPGLNLVSENDGLSIKRQQELFHTGLKFDAGKLFDVTESMANHTTVEAQEDAAKAKKDQPAPLCQADILGVHLEIPNPWDGLNYMGSTEKK